MKCQKVIKVIPKLASLPLRQKMWFTRLERLLKFCSSGIWHRDGVTLLWALFRNAGTCRVGDKREVQVSNHKHQSSNTTHRGGAICSSDERSVIDLEQRDCVVQLCSSEQPKMGRLT